MRIYSTYNKFLVNFNTDKTDNQIKFTFTVIRSKWLAQRIQNAIGTSTKMVRRSARQRLRTAQLTLDSLRLLVLLEPI
jgi:hypothetical protein